MKIKNKKVKSKVDKENKGNKETRGFKFNQWVYNASKFISKNQIAIWYIFSFVWITYLLFSKNEISALSFTEWNGNDLLFVAWLFLLIFPLIKEINIANLFSIITRGYQEKEDVKQLENDKEIIVSSLINNVSINNDNSTHITDMQYDKVIQDIESLQWR